MPDDVYDHAAKVVTKDQYLPVVGMIMVINGLNVASRPPLPGWKG